MSETTIYDAAFGAWEHPVITAQNAVVTALNESSIFPLAYLKAKQAREKRERMAGQDFKRIILLTEPPNLENVSDELLGYKIEKIATSEFLRRCTFCSEEKNEFDYSLVILTNNVLAFAHPQRFAAAQKNTPKTWYAIHDYDNHHWHEMSAQCALLADTYFPAHMGDYSFATRLEANMVPGVLIRSIQWNKGFVQRKLEELIESGDQRLETPDGWHAPYAKFTYRNSVVQKLSETFPEVGFTNAESFHALSQEEKWNQWAKYRFHVVIPTNQDLPIRFFDSIITRGVALVPNSLRSILTAFEHSNPCIIYYSMTDLIEHINFKKLIVNWKRQNPEMEIETLLLCHIDESINAIISKARCIR
jgi:hypothetical protein